MTYPILFLFVALAGRPVAIPSDAEPSTRLAASELTNYLYRITGKSSEVKVEGEGGQWNFSSVVAGTLKTLGDDVPATNAATCAMRNGFQINMPYATHIPYDKPDSELCRFCSPRVPHKLVDIGGDGQWVFGMWDTSWGWCECDACRRLDKGDKPIEDMPNVSTRFNETVKYLSGKVREHYSIGGIGFLSTAQYHPLVIGEPNC